MTRTDFICALSRYCERLTRQNTRPDRVIQIRATLQDFLRELEQDMHDQPGLFDHPWWGGSHPTPSRVTLTVESIIAGVALSMAPDVVRIRRSLADDWAGKPALFIRVVLSDAASARERLIPVVRAVEDRIFAELSVAGIDLYPYFSVRNQSECAALKDSADSKDWE